MREYYGKQSTGQKYSVLLMGIGWISAILSCFIYPFVFGMVGVVMGILSYKYGSRAALPLIVTSMLLMVVGILFGDVLLSTVRRWTGI